MNCRKAKKHIPFYLAPHSSWCESGDIQDLVAHLDACKSCKEEYEESRKAVQLLQRYGQVCTDTQVLLGRAKPKERKQVQDPPRTTQLLHLTQRIASIAAVIIICVGIGYWSWINNSLEEERATKTTPTMPQLMAPAITITENGSCVSPSTPIKSGSQIRELRINGKHRLVLNRETVLAIAPLMRNNKPGVAIKLTSGQILAEVQHDGNPFEVQAPHGKAVITGTVFDVSVTDDETTLVVAEGSVRFQSESGKVAVLAGHKSQLRAQSKPSEPLTCNANQLIAWASEVGLPIQPQIEAIPLDMTDLLNDSLASILYSSVSQPIDFESLDYDEFVESKRKWFKTQFPWIFELKKVLNDKGVGIDYPELLIKTGGICQIVYPERSCRIIPVFDPNSVLAIVKEYQLDQAAYTQIVTSVSEYHTVQSNMNFGIAAIERWLADCKEIQSVCLINVNEIETICRSSQVIGEYLENTRALLWLMIQNDLVSSSECCKKEMLHLLKHQVSAAYMCKVSAWNVNLKHADGSGCEEILRRLIVSNEAIRESELNNNKKLFMLVKPARE